VDTKLCELHFVDAPQLHDLPLDSISAGTDAWIEYIDALHAESISAQIFDPFMHSKAVFYWDNLATPVTALRASGVELIARSSVDAEGALVAHLGFSLAGHIWELVGPASSLPSPDNNNNKDPTSPLPSTDNNNNKDPPPTLPRWAEAECPRSHELPAPLSQLALAAKANSAGLKALPLFLGFGVAHHAPERGGPLETLYRHLEDLTGAVVTEVSGLDESGAAGAGCTVTELGWPTMPLLRVAYVRSGLSTLPQRSRKILRGVPQRSRTVADLDAWTEAQLQTFVGPAGQEGGFRWDKWAHALDQHVGMWYSGEQKECSQRASDLRQALEEANTPVAERQEFDAHLFYAGYGGSSMAWEFQFAHCDAGRPAAPSECACDADNVLRSEGDRVPGDSCPRQEMDNWCVDVNSTDGLRTI